MTKILTDHPRLYHYTNEQGLYGILNNKCIWATHYKFLNDYSEIELFKQLIIDKVPSIFKEKYYSKLVQEFPNDVNGYLNPLILPKYYESLGNIYYDCLKSEFYIASFCGEHEDDYINQHGLLSQWRAYGGDGGFAIVFKTKELYEMLCTENSRYNYGGLQIREVIYSDEDKKIESEFSKAFQEMSDYLNKSIESSIRKEQETPQESTYANDICIYKHQGFKEEREVRIVAILDSKIATEDSDNSKEKERKFRERNGRKTPYIELFSSLSVPSLPIEKIIVGPHKDRDSRASALRIKLRDTDIKVEVSDIPYQ